MDFIRKKNTGQQAQRALPSLDISSAVSTPRSVLSSFGLGLGFGLGFGFGLRFGFGLGFGLGLGFGFGFGLAEGRSTYHFTVYAQGPP
jgi:hypothetical protein